MSLPSFIMLQNAAISVRTAPGMVVTLETTGPGHVIFIDRDTLLLHSNKDLSSGVHYHKISLENVFQN